MADEKISAGDRVEWNTPQGKTVGKVKRKLTAPMKIKKHEVKASAERPEFLVETEKSHKLAAHQAVHLKKKA